jgi:oligopeptide/dipeptide ABC transporter ATP-binding protein
MPATTETPSTEAPPLTTEPGPPGPDGAGTGVPTLRIRDLRTSFSSRGLKVAAVRGVDIDLRPGEITVLLGESGSGKSVTAKSVMRLYGGTAQIEGRAELEGRDLFTMSSRQMLAVRGADVALVPQDPTAALDPLRRVGAQIVEVLRLHKAVRSKAEAKARSLELLDLVGIPDPARVFRAFPHELSGGMRQRAVIAIAVSCDPKVLIADEPTTALDVTVQAQILDLFLSLVSRLRSAVLLVTHDVGVASEVGDRVGVMYAGRIVEFGPAAEVLASPRHPYTRALLDSMPTPEVERGSLRSITGQPPVSGQFASGCAFHPRCPSAFAPCSVTDPELVGLGGNRFAACHLLTTPDGAAGGVPVTVGAGSYRPGGGAR